MPGCMDYLRNLDTSRILLASAALIGLLATLSMGLFGWKNHMPVEGKTVLITGASEGLGRSAARQLAAKGANIIIVSRNVGRLEETLAEVKAAAKNPSTQRFHYISADVSVPGFAAPLIADAIAWNGGSPPDIVWCVAGLSTPLLFAEKDALAALRYNMDVNFFGAAEVSHAVLSEWLSASSARGPGAEPKHLVLTSSVLALFAILGYGPYTPSKWALRGLADTLAQEVRLYPDNPVRVHVVYPGTILSPGFEREMRTKPEVTKLLEKDDPQQTPDQVAATAIRGLERGKYYVTVSWLGELMRWGIQGASPRNNWVVDTVMGWLLPFIYAVVQVVHNGQISDFAKKHGHPSTYQKEA